MKKLVLAISLLIFFSGISFGATYKIDLIIGKVTLKQGSKSISPSIGYILKKGDTIITGKDSECTIKINDKGLLKIEEQTTVTFDEIEKVAAGYKIDKISAKGNIIFSAQGVYSPKSRVTIKTETAFATVRGTEFIIESDEQDTTVYTLEGSVLVAPAIPDIEYTKLIDRYSIDVNEEEKITLSSLDVINATTKFKEGEGIEFLKNKKQPLTEIEKQRYKQRLQMLKELYKKKKSELQKKTKEYSKDIEKLFE